MGDTHSKVGPTTLSSGMGINHSKVGPTTLSSNNRNPHGPYDNIKNIDSESDALLAVRKNGNALQHLEVRFRENRKICLEAVKQDSKALKHVFYSLWKDREFCLILIKENVKIFHCVDNSLWKDREFCLKAIKENIEILHCVDNSLWKDREFCLILIKENVEIFHCVDNSLWKDREFCLILIKENVKILDHYMDNSLWKDGEFCLKAIKENVEILDHVGDILWKDGEFCLEAIKHNGNALKYVDNYLKSNFLFVRDVYKSLILLREKKQCKERNIYSVNDKAKSILRVDQLEQNMMKTVEAIFKSTEIEYGDFLFEKYLFDEELIDSLKSEFEEIQKDIKAKAVECMTVPNNMVNRRNQLRGKLIVSLSKKIERIQKIDDNFQQKFSKLTSILNDNDLNDNCDHLNLNAFVEIHFGKIPSNFSEFESGMNSALEIIDGWLKKYFQLPGKKTDDAMHRLENLIRNNFDFFSAQLYANKSGKLEEDAEEEKDETPKKDKDDKIGDEKESEEKENEKKEIFGFPWVWFTKIQKRTTTCNDRTKKFDIENVLDPVYEAMHFEYLFFQQNPMEKFPLEIILYLKRLLIQIISQEVYKNNERKQKVANSENYLEEIRLPEFCKKGYNQKTLSKEIEKFSKAERILHTKRKKMIREYEDFRDERGITYNENYEKKIIDISNKLQMAKKEFEQKRATLTEIALNHFPELLTNPKLSFKSTIQDLFQGRMDLQEYHHLNALIKERAIDEYSIEDTIRKNKVFKARFANETVVLKEYSLASFTDKRKLLREFCVLKKYADNHDNIIKVRNIIISNNDSFSKKMSVYLELPYFKNGDLQVFEKNNPDLDFEKRLEIMKGVANGLCFLHNHGVVHGDIKLENIVLDDNKKPVLIDFEYSIDLNTKVNNFSSGTTTRGVTISYCAPECYDGKEFSREADMYSFGVCLYNLMLGKYCQRKINERIHKIVEEDFCSKTTTANGTTIRRGMRELKDLLDNLIVLKPSKRLTIDRVINHPFFTGKIQCDYWNRCLAVAACHINLNEDIDRNEKFDKCFCPSCFDLQNEAKISSKNGQTFTPPSEFARIGIQPKATKGAQRDTIQQWHIGYHGTKYEYVKDILKHGQLLAPGSPLINGKNIQIRPGHIQKNFTRTNKHTNKAENFDPTDKIFLSPSIKYVDQDCYMNSMTIPDHGRNKKYRFALELLIQPNTYEIGQQTVGAYCEIDPYISSNSVEWYTNIIHLHYITAVLIKEV